jgi:signal transduction histidine kinase
MELQGATRKRQLCNLNLLIYDVVDEFEAFATANGILLSVNISTSPVQAVLGEEEQLYRLIANLVTNAIQYTPKDGKVTISLKQEDQQALIQVQDTGIGIPASEQSRIFDRFYRVNSDRSRQTGGAGLGLAIAQAIAQAHKGKIRVESKLEQGSLFTAYLPLKT